MSNEPPFNSDDDHPEWDLSSIDRSDIGDLCRMTLNDEPRTIALAMRAWFNNREQEDHAVQWLRDLANIL